MLERIGNDKDVMARLVFLGIDLAPFSLGIPSEDEDAAAEGDSREETGESGSSEGTYHGAFKTIVNLANVILRRRHEIFMKTHINSCILPLRRRRRSTG